MTPVVGTNAERQRASAYLRRHLLMFESEVSSTRERLTYFAAASELDLAKIYIEEIATCPAAFERLVVDVIRDKVDVVILPSMLHFAVLGAPLRIKEYFEAATGAQVLTLSMRQPCAW
jgi:hypothetical protein